MPAGSGPAVAQSAVAVPIPTTTETVVITTPACNVNEASGVLLSCDANYTQSASAGVITMRLRQGTGLTGTVVATLARTVSVAASANPEINYEMADLSAYAQNGQGQTWTWTFSLSAGTGTVNFVTMTVETIAPVQ